MHRRDFLTTVGFATLSACGLAASLSEPPQPTPSPNPLPTPPARRLKKAVMIGMVSDPGAKTIHDKFQLLRDCGFEGVEIDWPSSTPVEEFAAAQDKTGLKIHGVVDSVHWKHTLNHGSESERKKGLDALTSCLRAGKQLGATSVLLVPGVVNSDNSYEDCWRLSMEQIKLAIPVAQETGVQIAVENVWNGFLLSPLEAARYVDELNEESTKASRDQGIRKNEPAAPVAPEKPDPSSRSLDASLPRSLPPVAFHFDIGNIINAGWPHHWIKALGPRIAKLHIKDFSRKKRDDQGLWKGFDVELGEGDAQWTKVMSALDETGYSTPAPDNKRPKGAEGWATAEVRGGDRNRLTQIAQQMDALFKA